MYINLAKCSLPNLLCFSSFIKFIKFIKSIIPIIQLQFWICSTFYLVDMPPRKSAAVKAKKKVVQKESAKRSNEPDDSDEPDEAYALKISTKKIC